MKSQQPQTEESKQIQKNVSNMSSGTRASIQQKSRNITDAAIKIQKLYRDYKEFREMLSIKTTDDMRKLLSFKDSFTPALQKDIKLITEFSNHNKGKLETAAGGAKSSKKSKKSKNLKASVVRVGELLLARLNL